jgi:hypothetical protein
MGYQGSARFFKWPMLFGILLIITVELLIYFILRVLVWVSKYPFLPSSLPSFLQLLACMHTVAMVDSTKPGLITEQ